MAMIRTETGRTLDTRWMPGHIEPMFCSCCGCRIGWYDVGHGDAPVGWCDDCVPELQEDT